jgi:hypothetical protein
VYVPLGRSVLRVTAAGDMIPMGPDLGTGLPFELDGHVIDLVSTLTFMYALVSPIALDARLSPSVWAWSGEGWHQVMQGDPGKQAAGLHYSRGTQALHLIHTDGSARRIYLPDDTTALRRSDNLRYESTGVLDTGHYFGGMREVNKLWGDVTIHGCLPTGTSILIEYTNAPDVIMCGASWSSADEAMSSLGYITATGQTLRFPVIASSDGAPYMRLRLTLATADNTVTPLISAIVVRMIPRIVQQWTWSITAKLPLQCLTYRDGSYVADYDQALWDTALRNACKELAPIILTDIDGVHYHIAVTAFSRRVYNTHCDDEDSDILQGDIIWNITALQLSGDIANTDVEAWEVPVWPLPGPM